MRFLEKTAALAVQHWRRLLVVVALSGMIWGGMSFHHLRASSTLVASDSFSRTATAGWGTADLGGGYTLSGTATTFNVNGSAGTIQNTASGTKEARLGLSVQDTDMKLRITADKSAAGDSLYTGLLARRQTTGDQYRIQLRVNTSQNVYLEAAAYASGVQTVIGSETQVPGLSFTPGSYIWLRSEIYGTNPTTIKIKAWADGSAEPSQWLINVTNSSATLQAAGTEGPRAFTSATYTNYPATFSFDDYSVMDGVNPDPPPTAPPAGIPYTYAADSFERSAAAGWTAADTGGNYTLTGTASDFNVNGDQGTMNVPAPGSANTREALLWDVSAQDTESLVRVTVNQKPVGDHAYAYLALRHQAAGAEYRARLRFGSNGSFYLAAAQVPLTTSGSDNLIGSETAALGNYTPGQYIWVRMQASGTNPTTINIKAWPDGQGEPRNWAISATDSTASLQNAGTIGMAARLPDAVTNAPMLYTFDDYQTTNIITSSYPPGVTPPPLSGTDFYVATTGSDTNAGSIDKPWRTIKYAVTQLSPGQRLNIRGGTYYDEGGASVSLAGTAGAHITVRAYPGEKVVIDGALAQYETPAAGQWTLVNGSIGLWRTAASNFNGSDLAGSTPVLDAWLPSYDTQITHYSSKTGEVPDSINSTNYSLSGFNPLYIGPGVQLRGDGYVYIRLGQNPNDLTDWHGNPITPVPSDTDPNNNAIALSQTSVLMYLVGAHYVDFQGIDFEHSDFSFRLQSGTSNISFSGCTFNYGQYGLQVDDGSNVEVASSTFDGGVPAWVYWTDVKDGSTETSNGYQFQSNAITGVLSGWNVHDNMFHGGWDGLQVKTGTANASIMNNYFLGNRDDVMELRAGINNVEVGHNMMWHVHDGIGITRDTVTPGSQGPIYAHHNVIDVSQYQHIGRPGNFHGSDYGVWSGSSPFEAHSGTAGTYDNHELRFYNNTVVARRGRGSNAMGPRNVTATPELYVYNNVWYAIDNVPVLSTHLESSGAHYDGDVFWQPAPGVENLFDSFGDGGNYTSLSGYTQNIATTWEKLGLQTDPGFDLAQIDNTAVTDPTTLWSVYQPTNQQLATPGVSYANISWPGTAGVTYRGAVAPPAVVVTPSPEPAPPAGGGSTSSGGAVNPSAGTVSPAPVAASSVATANPVAAALPPSGRATSTSPSTPPASGQASVTPRGAPSPTPLVVMPSSSRAAPAASGRPAILIVGGSVLFAAGGATAYLGLRRLRTSRSAQLITYLPDQPAP